VTDARTSIAPALGASSGRPPSPRIRGWLLCCLGVAAALAAAAARPAEARLAAAQDWSPFVLVAGLPWLRARAAGARPSIATASRLGALSVPLAMAPPWALWPLPGRSERFWPYAQPCRGPHP